MKFALKIIIAFVVHCSFAQNTITVEVIDTETNDPVAFPTVKFVGTSRGVVADYNGQFRLPMDKLKSITSIEISSMGFQPLVIAISSLSTKKMNTLRMLPSEETLDQVIVNASKKKLSAFKIVQKAVYSIQSNLALTPHSYIGYYRDYQICNDGEYYNLNEAIVEEFDNGILSNKLVDNKNKSALYKFNTNLNYKTDSLLAVSYDDTSKNIKNAKIISYGGNELSILNAHNPIRLFNQKSFSYVYKLKDEFLSNHDFKKSKKIKSNGETLVSITFTNKQDKTSISHLVKGEVNISLSDFAIHSFKYTVYDVDTSHILLNVDIEYRRSKHKMHLNYISVNNLFHGVLDNEVFREQEITYTPETKRFSIQFNKKINLRTLKLKNFSVLYDNKEIPLTNLSIIDDQNIVLEVAKNADIINPEVKQLFKKEAANNTFNIKKIKSEKIKVFIKKVKDIDNRRIYERNEKPVYQFREFFVQEVFENKHLSPNINYVDKLKHLSKSKLNTFENVDDYIINSPLMNRKLPSK
ncbi:carboxypeptidase-like regulatory domain-containing protein [Tenacibaculum sp. 190130A14a]|uniref:Carboxypeptidase-like protein n=1 Tax=Tenacibaculum polynesiense TaxID=3137857 RepID=A0ABM9PE16_9FLAO